MICYIIIYILNIGILSFIEVQKKSEIHLLDLNVEMYAIAGMPIYYRH